MTSSPKNSTTSLQSASNENMLGKEKPPPPLRSLSILPRSCSQLDHHLPTAAILLLEREPRAEESKGSRASEQNITRSMLWLTQKLKKKPLPWPPSRPASSLGKCTMISISPLMVNVSEL